MNKSSRKEIDIVPSCWLDYKEYGMAVPDATTYMPESKLKSFKNCKLIQSMVKYCEELDATWPTFHVQIRGTAGNLLLFEL